jgi:hypothetical protein
VHRYRRHVTELLWKLEVDPIMWHCTRWLSLVPQYGIEVLGAGTTLVRLPLDYNP